MTRTFKELIAWQNAYNYCLFVYRVSSNFPDFEKYGLRSQFTRAAVSIPANIAEGYRKISKADKLRFFNIAQGSIDECRCYNMLSRDLSYINLEEYNQLEFLINGASKMLNAYCESIVQNKAIE